MSNFGPMGGNARQLQIPTPPKGEPIARYDTYLEAQRAVDFLSDNQFPVQFVTIVGSGLRMVERVTGRLTYGRVAVAGAASGAWFGLFVGVLLSIFASGIPVDAIVASMAIGAAFGILFGVISYALTGGRRDFTSTSQIVASEYEVLCLPEHAGGARTLLSKLPGGVGHPERSAFSGQGGAPQNYAGTPYDPARGPQGYQQPGYQQPGYQQPGYPQPGQQPYPGAHPMGQPVQPGQQGEPVAPEQPAEPITGPTYSEMIEKQRREREARERAEREAEAQAEVERVKARLDDAVRRADETVDKEYADQRPKDE